MTRMPGRAGLDLGPVGQMSGPAGQMFGPAATMIGPTRGDGMKKSRCAANARWLAFQSWMLTSKMIVDLRPGSEKLE